MPLLDKLREQYGVGPLCSELHIAPSTYYHCQQQRHHPDKRSARAQRDDWLKKEIQRVYDENHKVYGVRKVWRQLLREGIRVARCTVARLMAVMGLAGVLRGKKVRTTISRKAVAAGDRVNRQFVAERPDQLWVADFTYVSTWQGFVYVAFIIDVFAGYIVGWRVSSSMETTFVLDALEQALWARRPSGTVHHSDKGSQYVSLAYTQRLKEAGLLASTGSTGDSYDNAMAESINGLYKAEVIHRKSWKNRAEVELATLTWVDWYNNRRLLERLGHIPLNKLTANDLQQLFTWMKTDGGAESGLADSQVVNCHSLCHRALEKAGTDRLIARNPADGCKLPALKREEMNILSREAMQRLLIQAKEENYYELFLLEFATGLRLGELMGLQWDDLDLTTGELRVNKQVNIVGSELVVNEPKTKAAVRTLLLPPSVLKVMRAYRTKVESRWLFPSPKKEDLPLRPSVVHQRLHRLLDHAGCERVRFHDLRHTFATNALAHGMDVKTLSTILGHVSSATTLNTYSHVTDEMRQRAAVKIDLGIAKAEVTEQVEKPKERTMTAFQARKRWSRQAS